MKIPTTGFAALGLVLAGSALSAPLQGTTCWADMNSTVPELICREPIKDVTSINQLYERGWRVVTAVFKPRLGTAYVVEKQEAAKQ